MSKIYDALQRAEQERRTAVAEESNTSHSSTASRVATLFEGENVLVPAPLSAVPHAEVLPDTSDALSQTIGNGNGTLDAHLAAVQEVVWNPNWSRLPAVETRGPLLEQFRALRSRMHELRSYRRLKSVMVSSGLPQEGKSFVTVNLALALAGNKGNRVLLIDGDMRRASVHTMLGTTSQPGLSDYLGGKAKLGEILQRGISGPDQKPLPSAFDALTFIAAGGDSENAADLSGNGKFEGLLRLVEPYFEWIIVDSSPVNLVSDSVSFARSCDGVLFLVRSGNTRLEFAKRALEQLKASKLLGVVLNAVEELPVSHSYYGYSSDEAGEK